jgi:hypothetical protein
MGSVRHPEQWSVAHDVALLLPSSFTSVASFSYVSRECFVLVFFLPQTGRNLQLQLKGYVPWFYLSQDIWDAHVAYYVLEEFENAVSQADGNWGGEKRSLSQYIVNQRLSGREWELIP